MTGRCEGGGRGGPPSPLSGLLAEADGARGVGGAGAAARPRMGGAAEGATSAARPHPSLPLTWPGSGSGRVTWCRRPGLGALRRWAGGQGRGPALRSPERAPSGSGRGSGRRPSHGGWISRGPGRGGGGGGIPPARSAPAPAPTQGSGARSREKEGYRAPHPRTGPRRDEVAARGRRRLRGVHASLSDSTGEAQPGHHRVCVCWGPRTRCTVPRPCTVDLSSGAEAQWQGC